MNFSSMLDTVNKSWTNRDRVATGLILLFYLSGIPTIGAGWWPELVAFTPMILVGTLFLLIWALRFRTPAIYAWLLGSYLLGYWIEVAGVNTGVIFGVYTYGPVFGPQWLNTPLLIGVNWALLAWCTGVTINTIGSVWSPAARMCAGATLMTLVDALLEPVAMVLDYWDWEYGVIPWRNYLSWWLTSAVMQWGFVKYLPLIKHPVAVVGLAAQVVFFVALRYLLQV